MSFGDEILQDVRTLVDVYQKIKIRFLFYSFYIFLEFTGHVGAFVLGLE